MKANNILRSLILVGLFIVPFIPFVVSSSLLFPFITGKAFIFRFIVQVIFGLWAALALRDSDYRPKRSYIFKALSIFIGIVLLADIFALDSFKAFWSNYERMEGFVGLAHLYLYFIVAASVLKTKDIWNKFLATNVFASAIMVIYSFFQLAGKITINQGGVRVDGTFGNATYLGIYMVFNIFIAAILFLHHRSKYGRITLGVVGLLNLIVLYFTATRGAILGLIGGTFIAFVYLAIKANKGEKIRKFAVGFVLLLILGGAAFWSVRETQFVKNSPVLSRFGSLSFSEIKNQGRYYVWPMALKGVQEKPILGWGQEGFNYVFDKYFDVRMYNQEPWFDRTHNIILDWLVNAGVLGLASYLFIFVGLFISIRNSQDVFSKEEKGLLYGLVFAYFFHNLFVFDQIGSYILFFSILAYTHSQTAKAPTGFFAKVFDGVKSKLSTSEMKPVADSIIVIAILAAVYFVNYIPWQQNKDLIEVLKAESSGKVLAADVYLKPIKNGAMGQLESLEHVSRVVYTAAPSADDNFRATTYTGVSTEFEKHFKKAPYDVRHRIFYGIFLAKFGRYDDAITQLKEAIKYSPNKQGIYSEMGNVFLEANRPSDALEQFKKAYELETSNQDAKFVYAVGAIYAGNNALAENIIQGIPQEKILNDDRYLGALFNTKQFDATVAVLKKRIENDPINTQHRINLASVYLQIGRRQAAIQEIQEIIKINPSYKEQGEYYIKEINAGRNP